MAGRRVCIPATHQQVLANFHSTLELEESQGRTAKVSFQGHLFQHMPSKDKIPQDNELFADNWLTHTARVLINYQFKQQMPHGFTRGMSTSHSISTLFSTISTVPSVVLFLDMKAFELVSPLAIQATIHKRIIGRLLPWIGDNFRNRTAEVRFQGHLSQHCH